MRISKHNSVLSKEKESFQASDASVVNISAAPESHSPPPN